MEQRPLPLVEILSWVSGLSVHDCCEARTQPLECFHRRTDDAGIDRTAPADLGKQRAFRNAVADRQVPRGLVALLNGVLDRPSAHGETLAGNVGAERRARIEDAGRGTDQKSVHEAKTDQPGSATSEHDDRPSNRFSCAENISNAGQFTRHCSRHILNVQQTRDWHRRQESNPLILVLETGPRPRARR